MPRTVAVDLTFLASGFLLHDLPFNLSADLYRGRLEFPAVTLLFAVFGALALMSEALGIDLSRFPPWVRAASNLGWLTAGYGEFSSPDEVTKGGQRLGGSLLLGVPGSPPTCR